MGVPPPPPGDIAHSHKHSMVLLNSCAKVTVYLQGWYRLNGYSASQLHLRYPIPYIKLKLIEMGIQIFHCFSKKINSQVFRKVGT